jgi:hypothetical protein
VPQGRIGHKVRCKGCERTFRPDAALAQPSPEDLQTEKKRSSGSIEKPAKPSWTEWLKRPAIIDGAICGALGGILTGILMGAINSGLNDKVKPTEYDAETGVVHLHQKSSVGARVIGGALFGFTVGFACGAPIGGAFGLVASYFSGALLAAARRRALLTGMVTGAGVTALITNYPWMILLGIVPGALGSGFWSLLQNWEQAADKPFVSGFQLEEETPPEAASSESQESSFGMD